MSVICEDGFSVQFLGCFYTRAFECFEKRNSPVFFIDFGGMICGMDFNMDLNIFFFPNYVIISKNDTDQVS